MIPERRRLPDESALTPAQSAAGIPGVVRQPGEPAAGPEEDLWGHTGSREQKHISPAGHAVGASAPAPAPTPRGGTGLSITGLHKLALTYHTKGKLDQAERVYGEALLRMSTPEEQRTPEYPQVLNNVGRLYHEQGRYESAEVFYRRSLEAVRSLYGENHPKGLRRLTNLAELYLAMGRQEDAGQAFRAALDIAESAGGLTLPDAAKAVRGCAALLRQQGRTAEAEALEKRAGLASAIAPAMLRNAAGE